MCAVKAGEKSTRWIKTRARAVCAADGFAFAFFLPRTPAISAARGFDAGDSGEGVGDSAMVQLSSRLYPSQHGPSPQGLRRRSPSCVDGVAVVAMGSFVMRRRSRLGGGQVAGDLGRASRGECIGGGLVGSGRDLGFGKPL